MLYFSHENTFFTIRHLHHPRRRRRRDASHQVCFVFNQTRLGHQLRHDAWPYAQRPHSLHRFSSYLGRLF